MIPKKFVLYGLWIIFLILFSIPAHAANNVIYVACDGTGDYNCNPSDADETINEALKFVDESSVYDTVYLRGGCIYKINEPLYIGSDTTLTGDSSATIKLVKSVGWAAWVPLIGQRDEYEDNITITGFKIDVNYRENDGVSRGKGYYNAIYLKHCNDVVVSNMFMLDGAGDGLRTKYCSNIQFFNNTIYKLGHDGMYCIDSSYVEAWNNNITCRTNSGLRLWNTNHAYLHDNLIQGSVPSGHGIQIQKSSGVMDDVEVYNNTIHNTYGCGIWLIGYDNSDQGKSKDKVNIHHNIFYEDGYNAIKWQGGILVSGINGTIIENNVFDGCYNAGIYVYCPFSMLLTGGSGYITTVRNNIITDTQLRRASPSGTGYAIMNSMVSSDVVITENNCIYGNQGTLSSGVYSTNNIFSDPMYVDSKNHNYKLQASSPCYGLVEVRGFQGYIGEMGDIPDEEDIDSEEDNDTGAYIDFIEDPGLISMSASDVVLFAQYLNLGHGSEYLNILDMEVAGGKNSINASVNVVEAFVYYSKAPSFLSISDEYFPDGGIISTN